MPNYTDDMVATRSYSPLHHGPRPTDNNDTHTDGMVARRRSPLHGDR